MNDNSDQQLITVPSERFQDLPYGILLNIFLYCTGIKTIASLQGTSKRLYEIGSEEDYIWKKQVEAFYPNLLNKLDPFFIGYYFRLRNFVSSKKLAALTNLVNNVASSVRRNQTIDASSGDNMKILTTSSEINLSTGVCLGATAGLIFRQMSTSFSMLDTVNLNGQHLRVEGIEYLADAAEKGQLPFLKTLGLRQNKLGSGTDAERGRAGDALFRLLACCSSTIVSVDLSDNMIVGASGVKSILGPLVANHSPTNNLERVPSATGKRLSAVGDFLPQRLILNKNYLGADGVRELLLLYNLSLDSRMMYRREQREHPKENLPDQHIQPLPLMIALQNVGLGFTFKANDQKSIKEPSRASIEENLFLFESIYNFSKILLMNAKEIAKQRRTQKQVQETAAAEKRRAKFGTSSLLLGSQHQINKNTLYRHDHNNMLFESTLLLNDQDSSSSSGENGAADHQQLSNALTNQLRDEMPKQLPHVAEGLGMRMHNGNPRAPKGSPGRGGPAGRLARCSPELFAEGEEYDTVDSSVKLNVGWPSFTGQDPSSGCVIC